MPTLPPIAPATIRPAFDSGPRRPPDRMDRVGVGNSDVSLLSVVTLVLWLGCVTIGWLGFVLPYTRPRAQTKPPPPVQATVLNVQLTAEPLPPVNGNVLPPDLDHPPPPLDPPVALQSPPMLAVAEPSSAIAFALPVEGPATIVPADRASHSKPVERSASPPSPISPVQTLVYGRGEGQQPAPEYPPRAVREGQEGTVGIRFSVDPNGRVLEAEVAAPSPWRLLNDAALRAVRERWRFHAGAMRHFQVSVRFELSK